MVFFFVNSRMSQLIEPCINVILDNNCMKLLMYFTLLYKRVKNLFLEHCDSQNNDFCQVDSILVTWRGSFVKDVLQTLASNLFKTFYCLPGIIFTVIPFIFWAFNYLNDPPLDVKFFQTNYGPQQYHFKQDKKEYWIPKKRVWISKWSSLVIFSQHL